MNDVYTYRNGHLAVGDEHQIYFEDWGARNTIPVLYLHGGPGGGCDEDDKKHFDPTSQRVIFHDQRGSGRSTPLASDRANTTQYLIADIEKIRAHLGIETFHVCGGSWGSTLSLLYTIENSTRVTSLTIWSVFLGRQFELDFVNEGYARFFLPSEWSRFIAHVPEHERTNGTTIMHYYAARIRSGNQKEAESYAREWTLWESSLCSIRYDADSLHQRIWSDSNTRAIAALETHYFLNKCFIPENYILHSIQSISHIPCTIFQGRFDFCTPAISAHELTTAYGKNASLLVVNASHSSSDPELHEVVRNALSTLK